MQERTIITEGPTSPWGNKYLVQTYKKDVGATTGCLASFSGAMIYLYRGCLGCKLIVAGTEVSDCSFEVKNKVKLV